MGTDKKLRAWFETDNGTYPSVAGSAFIDAKKHLTQSSFSSSLRISEHKLIAESNCLDDVQKSVHTLLDKYQRQKESSKPRKWLQRASEIISYYGGVMDVFVQHHPEYVSLVWGTMKLLFVAVENHVGTVHLLAKTVVQIGRRLPQIDLVSELYPTAAIQLALEELYSHILKFLLRAHGWCNESRLEHLYHSITRPPEIRYKDLVTSIGECTTNITELASAASKAELRVLRTSQEGQGTQLDSVAQKTETANVALRDLDGKVDRHQSNLTLKLETLFKRTEDIAVNILARMDSLATKEQVQDFWREMNNQHSLQTSAQLDTNHRLSDIQLTQIMSILSNNTLSNHEDSYHDHLILRNRRIRGLAKGSHATNRFWLSPPLAKWTKSPTSALVLIKGPSIAKRAMRDFCVDVIQYLRDSAVPVLWALPKVDRSDEEASSATTADLLKNLALQALRIQSHDSTEKQMALRAAQFGQAASPREWLEIFARVLQGINGEVYVVVDLSSICAPPEDANTFHLVQELSVMLDSISETAIGVVVKVALVMYNHGWVGLAPENLGELTVRVRLTRGSKQSVPKGLSIRSPFAKGSRGLQKERQYK